MFGILLPDGSHMRYRPHVNKNDRDRAQINTKHAFLALKPASNCLEQYLNCGA
jgi:hypothetical protein